MSQATRTRAGWRRVASPARLSTVLAVVVGLYVLVGTIRMTVDCWYPLPYDDQWAQLVSGRTIDWAWLLSQHNEHRILVQRLISILDYWLAGERNIVDFACNLLVQAGFAMLLLHLATERVRRGAGRAWAAGTIVAFLFWAVQWDNFVWGFQVQFLAVMLAATATFASFSLGPATLPRLVAVIALDVVSTYALASGLAVPFLVVVLAIWQRRGWRAVALLTIAAIALAVAYLRNYHAASVPGSPLDLLAKLPAIFHYILVELGGPIAEAVDTKHPENLVFIATCAGAVCLAAFVVVAVRRFRDASPREATLLMLGGFLVAMTLLTGIGRVAYGLDQALAVRYATPASLFWLTVILLVAMRRSRAGMMMSLPLLLLIGLSQRHFTHTASDVTSGRAKAGPAILANVSDDLTLANIHTNHAYVMAQRARLLAAHTSVFADGWGTWLATPLDEYVTIADAARCQVTFDTVRPIANRSNPGWRAIGRINGGGKGLHPRSRIVLTDRSGKVVGYGLGGFNARQVAVQPVPDKDVRWWYGDFVGDAPDDVQGYLLLDDRTACPFGKAQEAHAAPTVSVSADHPANLKPGGSVDQVEIGSGAVAVTGWAMVQTVSGTPHVTIDTDLPVATTTLTPVRREDVFAGTGDPALASAGFRIDLTLNRNIPLPDKTRLCLWSDDPLYGRHLLQDSVRPDLCPS